MTDRGAGTAPLLAVEEALSEGWVAAAQAGDHSAFAALYRETQPKLLRYAAVLVGQDAEDVTAEAWLQIARDLHRFSGDLDSFRGWSATIVRHRAMDHLRAGARRPVTPVEMSLLLDTPADTDTESAAVERSSTSAALALIATLPREQAEAVLLREVVGLDAASAGKVLGKRAGAVRVAAHRGLKTLAGRLDEQQPLSRGNDMDRRRDVTTSSALALEGLRCDVDE